MCRGLREQATLEGREPKALAYTKPEDDLAQVVATLSTNKCSMAPILSSDPSGPEVGENMLYCSEGPTSRGLAVWGLLCVGRVAAGLFAGEVGRGGVGGVSRGMSDMWSEAGTVKKGTCAAAAEKDVCSCSRRSVHGGAWHTE